MLLFIGNRAINTDQIIEVDFFPHGTDASIELTLTSSVGAVTGDYNHYEHENVTRRFTRGKAWGVWLALRYERPYADDIADLRCPYDRHEFEPVMQRGDYSAETDEYTPVPTGRSYCTRCGFVQEELPFSDPPAPLTEQAIERLQDLGYPAHRVMATRTAGPLDEEPICTAYEAAERQLVEVKDMIPTFRTEGANVRQVRP